MAWTDVYTQFEKIVNRNFGKGSNWERKIEKEVDDLYRSHKGERDWDEAYRRWRQDQNAQDCGTLDAIPVSMDIREGIKIKNTKTGKEGTVYNNSGKVLRIKSKNGLKTEFFTVEPSELKNWIVKDSSKMIKDAAIKFVNKGSKFKTKSGSSIEILSNVDKNNEVLIKLKSKHQSIPTASIKVRELIDLLNSNGYVPTKDATNDGYDKIRIPSNSKKAKEALNLAFYHGFKKGDVWTETGALYLDKSKGNYKALLEDLRENDLTLDSLSPRDEMKARILLRRKIPRQDTVEQILDVMKQLDLKTDKDRRRLIARVKAIYPVSEVALNDIILAYMRLNETNDSANGSVDDYLKQMNNKTQAEVEKILRQAKGNPNADKAYRIWKSTVKDSDHTVLKSGNGYELGYTSNSRGEDIIYFAFPGESYRNPHMWLGKYDGAFGSNYKKAKKLAEDFIKTRAKDADMQKEYTYSIRIGGDLKRVKVKANNASEALDKVKKEAIKFKMERVKSKWDNNKLSTRDLR